MRDPDAPASCGRAPHWPCYLAGIVYLRTALWLVAVIGLAVIAARFF